MSAAGPKVFADQPDPRTLVASETLYEGRIWNVVSDTFSLSGDAEDVLVRDYIAHPGAVAVVAMDDHGRILLLKQYRQPVRMSLWEIPAGLLDVEGEDFVVAAARELAEEADLAAGRWDVLVDFFNSPGSSSEAIRIYLARNLTDVPEADLHTRTDEEAEIEHLWVDLDDAVQAVMAGRLHNPSAVAGVLAAAEASRHGFEGLRPADAPWPEHPSQRHHPAPAAGTGQ
ncbi:NUDIX domain-containing protein [Arthrobacter crystallopoietes]|uniref:NUDIX domain-containing protein n=1 Tax=Crystallibacter crystallopoietes TaxID=37928 RepID=UPI00111107FE|nr:NUDIX hydrolase [Arthrobacter crystallopoietes]QTG79873.1 NUDIX hydrolase [Arthrobacter crystallopoietes]